MQFKKFGASKHLILKTTQDLFEILNFHPSLWISTSSFSAGYTLDTVFLDYLDSDSNGRIISSELLEAIRWTKEVLKSYEGIDNKLNYIRLEFLNPAHEDYARMQSAVQYILNITDPKEKICLEHVQETKETIEKNCPFSESGIALPDAAKDENLKAFMEHVISITGGKKHPSGQMGVSQDNLDSFMTVIRAYSSWYCQYQNALKINNVKLLPLNTDTKSFYELILSLGAKIEQFFTQSKAYYYHKTISLEDNYFNASEPEKFCVSDPLKMEDFLKNAPLGSPDESFNMDINKKNSINPYYLEDLNSFFKLASALLKQTDFHILTESLWRKINSEMDTYKKWYEVSPCIELNSIDSDILNNYLNGSYAKLASDIIRTSDETAGSLSRLCLVEKIILYQQYLWLFAGNFVSFSMLYDPTQTALFEKGTLIIDGRKMNMSVLVTDVQSHKSIAVNSNLFLLYVEISPSKKPKYIVSVPVTSGVKGNLYIGKRGIFIDTEGLSSDAIVLDIVENPISIKETLIYPFKKIGRIFASRFDTLSQDSDNQLTQITSSAANGTGLPAIQSSSQNKASGFFSPSAIIMGGGVAIAALGSSITYIVSKLASISVLKIVVTLAIIFIILLAPAVISSYIKLRKRDLGSILEGSGWAVNAKMSLTRKLCKIFTQSQQWPKN